MVTGTSRSRDQLGSLAGETLIRLNADLHIEVALPSSGLSDVPGAGDPHALAVLDPGGNVDLPGAGLGDPTRPSAPLAWRLGDAAIAAAAVAGHGPDDLAEDASADLANLTRPLALGTRLDGSAGLGAVPAAALADDDRLKRDLPPLVLQHVLQVDLDNRPDVSAGRRAGAEPAEGVATPEEGIEDVLDVAETPPGANPPERSPSWPNWS